MCLFVFFKLSQKNNNSEASSSEPEWKKIVNPLPKREQEWKKVFDNSVNQYYFYNKSNGNTQWEQPKNNISGDQSVYYYDKRTGKTQWEKPKDFNDESDHEFHGQWAKAEDPDSELEWEWVKIDDQWKRQRVNTRSEKSAGGHSLRNRGRRCTPTRLRHSRKTAPRTRRR